MKFFKALLVMAAMVAVLGVGMVKMSNGHPGLLIASMIAFVIAFARIGCLSH